jgi:uncharacterized SAM-binding protein YcdF (DUF218 family)
VSDLFTFVFSVGGIVLALLVGTLWLWVRPQSRGPRVFLLGVAIGYGLASIYSIDHLALHSLSAGFRPFSAADVPPGRTAVIVMGSGSFTARDWEDNAYSMPDAGAASRVLEAARVFRMVRPEIVISSGGKPDPSQTGVATAVAMRDALLQLGVPDSRIMLQASSRNTREEALANLQVCRSLKIDHLIVVTSDFHMRRTVGAFRAAGVEIVPAIAREPWQARLWIERWLPSDLGLLTASLAAHEVLGLGYYRARGWYLSEPH